MRSLDLVGENALLTRPGALLDPAGISSCPGARLLSPQDREFLRLLTEYAASFHSAARLLGQTAGSILRRARLMNNRLHHPLSKALALYGRKLPKSHLDVGTRRYIQGQSGARICRELAISRRKLELILADLRGWQFGLRHKN